MSITGDTAVRMIPLARKLGWVAQKKYGMDREDVQQQALLSVLEQGISGDCNTSTLHATVIMRSALAKEFEKASALKRSMSVQMGENFDVAGHVEVNDVLAQRKLNKSLSEVLELNAAMFKAVYILGFSREDVATQLGMTAKAVSKRIERVLSKVADDFDFQLPNRRKNESSSIYSFVKDCGDAFSGTRAQFMKYSGLTSGTVGDLFKGSATVRKGWRVLT